MIINSQTLYAVVLILIGISTAFLPVWLRRRYSAPGWVSVVTLLLASAEWTITYALELASSSLAGKIFWDNVQFIGILAAPTAWFGYTIHVTGRSSWFTWRKLLLLSVVPAITLALVTTNESHRFIWQSYELSMNSSYPIGIKVDGIWIGFLRLYSYALLISGALLVICQIAQAHSIYYRRGIALLIGVSVPFAVNIFDELFPINSGAWEYTQLAITATAMIVLWNFTGLQRQDIASGSYQAVLNSMLDGVLVIDTRGLVVALNPSACQMIGLQKANAIGSPVEDIFKGWTNWTEAALARQDQEHQMELDWKDIQFDLRASPVRDRHNHIISQVIVLRDITHRKQIEAALQRSEETLRLFFENVNDVVYSMNSNLVITNITPSVEKVLGYLPKELVGRPFQELNILAPQFNTAALQDALRVLSGERIDTTIYEFIRKDGQRRWGEVSGAPLVVDGKVQSFVSIARDVTERILAQEQITASLKEKEALLKEIHHRVKNNLQVISSLLSLQSHYTTDEKIRTVFQESRDRVRSMALIHEKLYSAKDLASISFAEYLHNLVEELVCSYRTPDKRIDVKVQTEEIFLDIDSAVPCGLIVNELVSNSFKHAFPDRTQGELEVSLQSDITGQVIIEVKDNGSGLPDGLDTNNPPSLGLNIVKSLTAQLDANLHVKNKNGTCIQLLLPPRRDQMDSQ